VDGSPASKERIVGSEGIKMIANMTTKEIDGVSVVVLGGRIVLGPESSALRDRVKSLLAEGKKKIVLNMADVTYIDSAGLGMLVAAHVSAKNQGAGLRLSNSGNKFNDVLQLTRLLTVFSVHDTESDAIRSFGPAAATA